MVNCNPETVSTDYDTSDRLYFEPLDVEAVLAVCEREQPEGVVIQFGGQTPLKLARAIESAGHRILGTPFDAVDLAEDRERFGRLLAGMDIACPEWGIARSPDEAVKTAERIGYPVLVRPSYVLGGRAMRVCNDPREVAEAFKGVHGPTLVDRFLDRAIELDVDALCDGSEAYVAAVMQHVEEAGVHSGDSACVLPPQSIDAGTLAEIGDVVRRLGPALGVVGLLNVQLAVVGSDLYVLEVNPRASRTVPVRIEGDRDQPRRRRLPVGRRRAARRPRAPSRTGAAAGKRQGRGAAVRALPRCGSRPRPRDALHGRGDGQRLRSRHRAREGRARRRTAAAGPGIGVPVGARRRQGRAPAGRGVVCSTRVPSPCDGRDRQRRSAPQGSRSSTCAR